MVQQGTEKSESSTPQFFKKVFNTSYSLLSKAINFYTSNVAIFTSIWISLLSLLFFISVTYQDFFSTYFNFFRVRWFGVSVLVILALLTFFTSYLKHQKRVAFLLTWLQSNILTIISYSYLLGIENKSFYPFIIAFLTALILLVNYDLFGKKKYHFYILVIQVLLFSLQSFSWINLLAASRVEVISFHEDLLSNILKLPSWLWLAVSSLGITLITISSFGYGSAKKTLIYTPFLFYIFFQMFLVVENLNFANFFYWQKTLLFLIFWDFVYLPLKYIIKNTKDDKYQPRLVVSTIYHVALVLIIYLSPNLL
ncbi:MAG: hypothetical protein WCK98_03790 [bacterium]